MRSTSRSRLGRCAVPHWGACGIRGLGRVRASVARCDVGFRVHRGSLGPRANGGSCVEVSRLGPSFEVIGWGGAGCPASCLVAHAPVTVRDVGGVVAGLWRGAAVQQKSAKMFLLI